MSAAPDGSWNLVRKTSARIVAGSLALGLGLQLLPGCATTPKPSGGGAPTGGASGPSGSGTGQPGSSPSSPTTAGGRSGRVPPRTSTDTVERAALMGLAFGAPFGLIGAGAGALIGFIYGNLAKREADAKANEEAKRQETMDADLERQIAEQKAGGGSTAGRKQGVTVVKDHLANRPGAPAVASTPSPSGQNAGEPARGTATGPRTPTADTDADGFRPVYEGGRLVRRERDAQGDGRPDTILHYGVDGQLVRREDASRLDGRMDLWTHYANGKMKSRESDTRGTGQVDLWIYYDDDGRVARAESLLENDVKLTQIFTDGQVTREEWRRLPDGELTAVATHEAGKLVQREEDSTGRGRLDLVSVFDPAGRLVKQGRRTEEGWLMSWRHFDPAGRVVREEELGKDGEIVTISFFEEGRLMRKELYVLDEELIRRAPRVPEKATPTEG